MTTAHVFAACYLAGLAVGAVCAAELPWWLSGGPAWVLLLTTIAADIISTPRWGVEKSKALGFGCFFGAMSGAAAADFAEVADLLIWPGHDSTAAMSAALGVGACWALASVLITPSYMTNTRHPAIVGAWLYIGTAVIAYAPLLAEAWS